MSPAEMLEMRVIALPDPNTVGTTEYRCAWDLAWDCLEVAVDAENPVEFMGTVIDNAINELVAIRMLLTGA